MKKQVKRNFLSFILGIFILAVAVGFTACGNKGYNDGFDAGYAEGWRSAKESNNYYIYYNLATLPTLNSMLHYLSHENPSYVYYERTATYDNKNAPRHVTFLEGNRTEGLNAVKALIADLEEQTNKEAYYNFYTEDLRVLAGYYLFLTNNVPESRFNITLQSDGTGTYNNCFTNHYLQPNGAANFEGNKAKFETVLEFFKDKDVENYESFMEALEPNPALTTFEARILANNSAKFAILAAQRSNVKHLVQFPEYFLIKSDMPEIMREILKSSLTKAQPYDLFNTLSKAKCDLFFDMIFNNENNLIDGKPCTRELVDGYLSGKDKPILIITGTSVYHDTVYDEIVSDYGNYAIFFKPHPTYPPINTIWTAGGAGKTYQDYFTEHGITVLPAQLPMEAIMWAYPEAFLGGYNSSLYMSTINPDSVLFFINEQADILNVLKNYGFFGTVIQYNS